MCNESDNTCQGEEHEERQNENGKRLWADELLRGINWQIGYQLTSKMLRLLRAFVAFFSGETWRQSVNMWKSI